MIKLLLLSLMCLPLSLICMEEQGTKNLFPSIKTTYSIDGCQSEIDLFFETVIKKQLKTYVHNVCMKHDSREEREQAYKVIGKALKKRVPLRDFYTEKIDWKLKLWGFKLLHKVICSEDIKSQYLDGIFACMLYAGFQPHQYIKDYALLLTNEPYKAIPRYSLFSLLFIRRPIEKNLVPVVRRLIEAGVLVNFKSPLHQLFFTEHKAKKVGNENVLSRIIKLLVKHGADINDPGSLSNLETPLDVYLSQRNHHKHPTILKTLRDLGAKTYRELN